MMGMTAMTEKVMKMMVVSARSATMMFIVAHRRMGSAVHRPTMMPMKAEFVSC